MSNMFMFDYTFSCGVDTISGQSFKKYIYFQTYLIWEMFIVYVG